MVYCNNLPSKYPVEAASRDIENVCNIEAVGWENLTPYQKRQISLACEEHAIFRYENQAALDSSITSLQLGGVSMTIDLNKDNLYEQNGVIMKRTTYNRLLKTGLCCRLIP